MIATGHQRRHRIWAVLAALGAMLGVQAMMAAGVAIASESPTATGTEQTGGAKTADDAEQLARRYVPVVTVRQQDDPCGAGEPFAPEPVEAILDQPDVVLRDADGNVIVTAPSAVDLANAPEGSNIDLPGTALTPGCDYARRFGRARAGGDTPTVYARVVSTADANGAERVVVQYWMYFVYNQWNNRHEGDWEMAQVVFHATTPGEALLRAEPDFVGIGQHDGAQRRAWSKVGQLDGQPEIFVGAGSHALYFSADLWLGTSSEAGFGCDDTRRPSDRLFPAVTMLPDARTQRPDLATFGWLTFPGYWGERGLGSGGFNDSETGPQTTEQWHDPLGWMAAGRTRADTVPNVGLGSSTLFCSATAGGSRLLNQLLAHPRSMLIVGLGLLVVAVLLITRTRWRPTAPRPVALARRGGATLLAALRLVINEWRRFLPAAFIAASASAVIVGLQVAVLYVPFLSGLTRLDGRSAQGAISAIAVSALISAPLLATALAVAAVAAERLRRSDSPEGPTSPMNRYRVVGPTVVLALVVAFTGPLALILYPLWATAPADALAGNLPIRAALRTARRSGKGRRLSDLVKFDAALLGAVFVGRLIGMVAIVAVGWSYLAANIVTAVVSAIAVPWLAAVAAMSAGSRSSEDRSPHRQPAAASG